MSRLTDAAHFAGQSNITSNAFTERSLSYDRNGNITALQRYDENGIGTSLSFALAGNRIASNTYDAMGNMTRDSRTGLQFSYNIANLPKVVRRADGETLTYTYLADGTKWSATPSTGSSLKYHGSFVFENDGNTIRPSSVAWDEGRISYHYAPEAVDSLVVDFGEEVVLDSLEIAVIDSIAVEDGICDEWHVRDHLGSVRAVVGIGNYITGIRELNTYLPFGMRIPGSIQALENRHRFSGKEEQGFGLDPTTGTPSFSTGHLDFGARYYDPYTCRWTTRDPLAGKYHSLSPYNYCAGNTVNLVDPNGTSTGDYYNMFGNYIGNDGEDNNTKYLVLDNKEQKKVKQNTKSGVATKQSELHSSIIVPSNNVINAMDSAFSLTETTNHEHGFRVGINGTVTTIIEGTENEISNWDIPIGELREKGEYAAYDVHTHPQGNPDKFGKAEPSTKDKNTVIKSSGQPSVVLGYDYVPSTTTSLECIRMIGYYNQSGPICQPVSYDSFKRAINKINQ